MITPLLCVTIFLILVVCFLYRRVARLIFDSPLAIIFFVCLYLVFLYAVFCARFALLARPIFAWATTATKLIVNRAIAPLPAALRPFFDNSRAELLNHVNDPFVPVAKTPAERKNQFLYLEKYGRFPFELLPRNYKAPVTKFGKSKLESNALLPWQIAFYTAKLTEPLHTR